MTLLEPRPIAYADPDDVAAKTREWTPEQLECRAMRHSWRSLRAVHNKRYGYYQVTHECPRCGTQRNMEMSTTGKIFSTWYDYPDGYLSEGLGRIAGDARDVVMLAMVVRTFNVETVVGGRKGAEEDVPRSIHTRMGLGIELMG